MPAGIIRQSIGITIPERISTGVSSACQDDSRVRVKNAGQSENAERAETTLAGIFDGGCGAGNFYGRGLHVRGVTRTSGISRASGATRSVAAASARRAGDGIDGCKHHLFALWQTVGSALQPISHS